MPRDRVLAVNLTGAFLLAKYGIPELAAAGGGTMVISGSANSFTADRSWAAYCASKGGPADALPGAGPGPRQRRRPGQHRLPGLWSPPRCTQAWLRGRPGGQPLAEVRAADLAAHPR